MEEQPAVNTQNQQSSANPTPVSKKPNYWIIAGIIFVLLLGFGGIYALSLPSRKPISPPPKPLASPSPTSLAPNPAVEYWKTYANNVYNFTVKFPPKAVKIENDKEDLKNIRGNPVKHVSFIIRGDPDPKGYSVYQVNVYPYHERTIEDWIKKYDHNWPNIIIKDVFLSGFPAKRVAEGLSRGNNPAQAVYTLKNNYIYVLEISSPVLTEQIIAEYDLFLSTFKFTNPENQVVCTQDAKLCPDGSYVSRQPPNCEFTKCP